MKGRLKKAKIIANGMLHNAIILLVIAATIAAWLYIMYECLLGGWE